ncbi:uncharacterized protein LOC128734693 [Sabethes cyaneus]|uniref:uncharacterized protein LOC128734693 n=1 Tax=Sabethes cyaneus TaxID=53552 RepID=UPI00237DD1C4|nr:uncharacterized protein LOC128734693 [Sabethes cyaneus]
MFTDNKLDSAGNVSPENVHSSKEESRIIGILATEDSCNAVDNKIFIKDCVEEKHEIPLKELSFNGKIASLNLKSPADSPQCKSAIAKTLASREDNNQDKLNESFEILTKENSSLMHYNNEKSPDLFPDANYYETSDDEKSKSDSEARDGVQETSLKSMVPSNSDCAVSNIEQIILKRIQSSLSGVLPPPTVTYSQIDINRMLNLYKENESRLGFTDDVKDIQVSTEKPCLSKPTHSPTELFKLTWPDILKCRAHGLYYNRSSASEKIELLGLKYVDRYIGSETGTTFNVIRSPSSAKKRNLRLKMLNQSPGSRLSHLARRRAVFSSANLLNSSIGSATAAGPSNMFRSCNRQILLDTKKSDNRRKNKGRTPKRRTPGRRKTPSRRKTPGSSSKKRTLSLPIAKHSQPVSRESSKRALFQSPPRDSSNKPNTALASSSTAYTAIGSSVANKAQKSKRALFSPPKRTHRFSSVSTSQSNLSIKESLISSQRYGSTSNIDLLKESSGLADINTGETVYLGGKRKRPEDQDDDTDLSTNAGKIPRIDSIKEEDLTPRSLKLARSQSFCGGSKHMNSRTASENALCGKSLFRASSEVTFPDSGNRPVTVLTENHKKKLLWAVSQALQTKQITVKHNKFKDYASSLARVVKRLFLEFNDQIVSSTSEKLLRLANKHVFEVIEGHSVDDIYLKEKTRIMNARNFSKLQGYIAPEDYEYRKQMLKRSTSTSVLVSENSSDASSSQMQLSQRSFLSQSSEFLNQLSQTSNNSSQVIELSGLQNTVLRENIDSEQRQKSAQKQVSFSGKDQKNLSPYADKGSSLAKSAKLLVGGVLSSTCVLKAKRQISFE